MDRDGLRGRLVAEGALDGLDLPWDEFYAEAIRVHASTRDFFRIRPVDERGRDSAVLVVYPPENAAEVQRHRATADWFATAGLRVPTVLSTGTRSVLVEDCGVVHLDDSALEPGLRRRAYRQAVDSVLRLQRYGFRVQPANPDLALDRERLRWELGHMEEHALGTWLGVTSDASVRERAYDRLADAVADLPVAACHRDYHARNLLVLGRELVIVDFQDVMSGPHLYDLASLLWDNYCDVGHVIVGESLHRYWTACASTLRSHEATTDVPPGLPPGLPGDGRRAFCLVALQRSLKALGTFGYQVAVAGNAYYADYVPRTWRHTRTALRALGWDDLAWALRAFEETPRAL